MDAVHNTTLRSRQNSKASTPISNLQGNLSKPPAVNTSSNMSRPKVHYTVFIRLPFPRNGFEDPSPVEWDTSKDETLSNLIFTGRTTQQDFENLSTQFQVSMPFLMQQAAWLWGRRFESMKAQMKGLDVSGAATPSPQVQSESGTGNVAGGVGMTRTGSKGSRIPSAIATPRDSPLPTGGTMSSSGTPRSIRPNVSRTPSSTTVTQSRVIPAGPRQPSQTFARTSYDSRRRASGATISTESSRDNVHDQAISHDGASESDSEEEPAATTRSQPFRRSPLTRKPVMASLSSDGDAEDDDDDDSGGFLPFAAASRPAKVDLAATLRNSQTRQTFTPQQPSTSKDKHKKEPPPDSSASSASSNQPLSSNNGHSDASNRPGPLSPRQRAALEQLSPRYKKSGSEGSPSMGSSFSDLDDASITKSALEDALLSNMQHGSLAMGSRISTLRDALARK